MEAGDRVARDGPSWLPQGGWGGLLLGPQLHWAGTVRGFANLLICFSREPGTLERNRLRRIMKLVFALW